MQWHKVILSNFSLALEDQTVSNASQVHLLGSGLVISHWKDSDDREEKKKKKEKTNRPPSISMGGLP